jgi:hypothetical protein
MMTEEARMQYFVPPEGEFDDGGLLNLPIRSMWRSQAAMVIEA